MKSRTFNSIRNTFYAFMSQGATSILSFITRTVFIYTLGNTYLGLNGLFSDILTLLSLAELGIGTAIIYSMYKPVAENDERKISALISLYEKIYTIIGIIVTIIGLSLTPFLSFFISDMPNISNLNIIYLLYLLNTSLSYFFVYKRSMLIATQQVYIASKIQIVASFAQNIIQIIVLLLFKNFILYLLVQVVFVLVGNIYVSIYVDKKYSYLKKYKNESVDKKTKKEITKNVAAMFLNKISSAIVTSTDNILISKYVSTIILGYYSNYILFINLIKQVLAKIFESITGSLGNFVASESKEKSHETFNKIFFVNFWMVGLSTTMLFILINPFIEMWVGDSYKLNTWIVLFICINLYMRLIRNTTIIFIDTYGLFWNSKWKCVAEALINLIASLMYLKIFDLGLVGVLLGTFTSNILTNFWVEPYIIYKNKFKINVKKYFISFFKYFFTAIIAATVAFGICNITVLNLKILEFILDFILSAIIINVIYIIMLYRSNEFKYLKDLVSTLIEKLNLKLKQR